MKFDIQSVSAAQASTLTCELLVVPVTKQHLAGKDTLSRVVEAAVAAHDLETAPGKLLQMYQSSHFAARRVILVGAGDGTPKQVMQAVGAALSAAKASAADAVISLCMLETVDAAVLHAVVSAANDATYCYTLTKGKVDTPKLKSITVGVADAKPLKAAWARSVAIAHGVNTAKEWGNRPGNYATPSMLGDAAKKIAKAKNMSCEVLGEKQIAALGMGSFLAVAQGSREPARFIVMKYQGAAKSVAPKVLVGKGITFDTGGISLKPGAEMDEMKFDMCGAASVLGTFTALAELQPEINVVGLIPACENMPDGRAIKPGDVVRSMSGQTIEILNTDAEGRLILCDALTYAERFKPEVVVDIATLTGACVIALGAIRSGMYATTDALAHALMEAGDAAQDLCWRMPLDDEYSEALKSNFADMANVGGRPGGSITAAKFLHKFAQQYPWAHLDIAGTAWKSGAAKGATGRPVGLLVNFLLQPGAAGSRVDDTPRGGSQAKKSKSSGRGQIRQDEVSQVAAQDADTQVPLKGGAVLA